MITHDVTSAISFVGYVENVDDPLKLGRIQVRVINHEEDLETSDLRWASCLIPTTSSGVNGTGASPTSVSVGALAVGIYIDGSARNQPIVLGILPVAPGDDDKHSVSYLARGGSRKHSNPLGPELSRNKTSTYPLNKVFSTPGGHIIEYDDTQGNSRITFEHAGGSYVEIGDGGSVTIKSATDRYDITGKDAHTYVGGASDSVVRGKKTVTVSGDYNIIVNGNCNITSTGTVAVKGAAITLN